MNIKFFFRKFPGKSVLGKLQYICNPQSNSSSIFSWSKQSLYVIYVCHSRCFELLRMIYLFQYVTPCHKVFYVSQDSQIGRLAPLKCCLLRTGHIFVSLIWQNSKHASCCSYLVHLLSIRFMNSLSFFCPYEVLLMMFHPGGRYFFSFQFVTKLPCEIEQPCHQLIIELNNQFIGYIQGLACIRIYSSAVEPPHYSKYGLWFKF